MTRSNDQSLMPPLPQAASNQLVPDRDEHQVPANAGAGELTRAGDDQAVVQEWLRLYEDKTGRTRTQESYRREADRLLQWCAFVGTSLRELTVDHLQQYHAFLLDPQPAAYWCSQPEPKLLPDGSPNPAWHPTRPPPRYLKTGESNPAYRPFVSALSEAAAKQAMVILHGLGAYLEDVGYLAKNPWRVVRSRIRTETKADTDIERFLEPKTVKAVLAYLEGMPRDTKAEVARNERDRLVFSLLYYTGLRRDELARARAHDVKLRGRAPWLYLVGKGRKVGKIPLSSQAMAAINRYRESLGRAQLPVPKDAPDEPLVLDVWGRGQKHLTGSAIYAITKNIFEAAAAASDDPQIRANLLEASTHWMRHTACSAMVNDAQVPVNVASKILRHRSVATTSRYLHAERDRLSAEIEKLSLP